MAYKLSPIHKPVPLKSTTQYDESESESESEIERIHAQPSTPSEATQLETPTTTLEPPPLTLLIADEASSIRFSLALFLFGLLNNVLYVIILSAALDLVPSDVPTGVILVADITPSLLVKIGWPYFVKGKIRYARRILSCSALSFAGMMVIVIFSSVPLRLLGISLASVSSGLGEMTFLQLTTRYHGQPGVSWFASGTGAAGVVGAAFWWLLRHLGVQIGLGLSSVLPICLSFTYFFLLPPPNQLPPATLNEDEAGRGSYEIVPASSDQALMLPPLKPSELTFPEKLRLARPLLIPYMLPLFAVYFAEYTINTAIAPTLLYPPPRPESNPVFSLIFKSLRDYYPFWQLTYQIFVFFSRSSMAIFRFPALPRRLIPLPSLLQMVILCVLLLEASNGFLSSVVPTQWIYMLVFAVISLEGVCGGLAYVSAYYWLGMDGHNLDQEKEFRIACVGFADTFGILLASIFSSWLEPRLCGIQVSHGRMLCRERL
ncbi:hypothetical protein PCANC_05062 [Puccinia coronata f. sp. avenae]|uniref:Protein BTN n=1 Tax=Puccinia coronata f. sp. avenae TaxID=200324 RepID=A0A2N5T706_9BASI|nr:hypothetical protein PCANC_05062 [Puccinia coronata f. sp. avenae]